MKLTAICYFARNGGFQQLHMSCDLRHDIMGTTIKPGYVNPSGKSLRYSSIYDLSCFITLKILKQRHIYTNVCAYSEKD